MRVGPTWLTPSAYILSKILKARSANTKGRREYLFVCNLSVRLSPTTGGKHIFSFRCQLCTRAAASNREGIVRCKLPFEERRVTKLHRLSPRRHPPQEGEGRPRGGGEEAMASTPAICSHQRRIHRFAKLSVGAARRRRPAAAARAGGGPQEPPMRWRNAIHVDVDPQHGGGARRRGGARHRLNLELGATEQVDSAAVDLNSATSELKSAADQLQSIAV
jgi:hypothetical protein